MRAGSLLDELNVSREFARPSSLNLIFDGINQMSIFVNFLKSSFEIK